MPLTTEQRNRSITSLLNGTNESLKSIIPLDYQLSKPGLLAKPLNIQFGVLIGFTGDLKGKLILSGELDVFGAINLLCFSESILIFTLLRSIIRIRIGTPSLLFRCIYFIVGKNKHFDTSVFRPVFIARVRH